MYWVRLRKQPENSTWKIQPLHHGGFNHDAFSIPTEKDSQPNVLQEAYTFLGKEDLVVFFFINKNTQALSI